MVRCSVCNHKMSFKKNLKSVFTRHGEIVCENCNAKFRIKNNFLSHVADFIIILVTIVIMDRIGGLKGILLGSLLPISILIIELITGICYVKVD